MKLFNKKNKHQQPSEMKFSKRYCKLKEKFYNQVGYELNLENPQTFNEKINWMKLFYRNDLMTRIVDKYEFKNYIKEQLGDGYTVPLLGVWNNVDDIDFDKLPDKFVLKSNAQSSGHFIKIIKDKNSIDTDLLKNELKNWLIPENTLITSYCWAYNNVEPKIIAEEYIEQIDGQVYDYKFMCCNGEPKWVLACSDRGQKTVYENHDLDWNLIIPSPNSAKHITINRPKYFDKMIEIAKKLSAPFPFVRVDFYEIEDKVLLGEMTFYPNGGYNTYKPSWDRKFGEYINLPKIKVKPPFFEKVKNKSKRIIKINGKKIVSYHKSLSRKELTKELDLANENIKIIKNELLVTTNELSNIERDLKIAQTEIKKLKTDLASRPKLQPSQMRFEERKEALKLKFYRETGYKLDLDNPQTLNEKINWMKLFYRNDLMTRIVDKYEFKNYIKEQLGDGYTVPLLGVWDRVEDIDFDKLPNKFVLKSNAQSDGKFIKIVKNKDDLDIDALKEEMQGWLKPEKTLKTSYCWAYNNVPLKIIAEKYIEQIDGQVYDYKFFCFNGEPKMIYIATDHFPRQISKISLFDLNWKKFDVKYGIHPNIDIEINKPKNFDKMLEISTILSKDFPFVRVDFYEIKDKIYIGEVTFYSGGGYNRFDPIKYDSQFGEWLDLSKVKQEYLYNGD